MTIEEIKTAELETVEARALEIAGELETAEPETLDTLSAELDAIQERKAEIRAAAEEKRAAMRDAIDAAETIETVEKQEERKTMEKVEVRSTPEYLDAWVEDIKGRATNEQRALLTENATHGTIAVPTYAEDGIKTAWENNEFFRRIRKTYFSGNLKIGYEVSASGAVVHTEGGDEVAEEELVLGVVELTPVSIKKWVSFSDEALDMRGEAFVDYIVDELTDKIIKGVIQQALVAINASSLVGAVQVTEPMTTMDIIRAEGMLSGGASDVVLITTRQAEANLKAGLIASANFPFDATDGLPVIYVDSFPGGNNAPLAVVADMSAIHANFPNGDDVKIKVDETTLMTSDLVRVLGRLYVGIDVTAPGRVVKLMK